MGFNSGFKGLR